MAGIDQIKEVLISSLETYLYSVKANEEVKLTQLADISHGEIKANCLAALVKLNENMQLTRGQGSILAF